ncbi:hypothetical protein PAGU2595_029620 [Lysobacter xanthus]
MEKLLAIVIGTLLLSGCSSVPLAAAPSVDCYSASDGMGTYALTACLSSSGTYRFTLSNDSAVVETATGRWARAGNRITFSGEKESAGLKGAYPYGTLSATAPKTLQLVNQSGEPGWEALEAVPPER